MAGEATVHASAVRVDGRGVLIRGASGSGKSSLVLSLLALRPEKASLIADDRVALANDAGRLVASVPSALAGLLEVRGLGIVRRAHVSPAAIDLVADLLPLAECPRMPDEDQAFVMVERVRVSRVFIAIGAPDGAPRVLAALAHL